MRTHAGLFLVGLISMMSAACQLQTLEEDPATETTEDEGNASCSTGEECEEDVWTGESEEETSAEETRSTDEEEDSCAMSAACEEPVDECDPTTGTGCEDGMEAEELELIVARPIEKDEPPRATYCGADKEKGVRYRTDCMSLELECNATGGSFLCHDASRSDECKTWGGCHFLSLQAVPVDPGALPEGLGKSSGDEGGLADTSEFGCGENKGCCLFVPGAGDSSADCGGFLASCEFIGCTPSGGNHVASCQC